MAKKTAARKKSVRRKRPSAKTSSTPRASWKGNLTFGLVSFPVQGFNALNREQSDIRFNQLHAECHRRIRYQKVCPEHGEVTNDEIVSGYEYQPGKYVEIEPEELDELRTKSERALVIDTFVAPEAVDMLYLDGRMYYLLPAGTAAEEPYEVFLEALDRQGCFGIGQVVFSGKDQLALVRPVENTLHMALLNYEAEIRHPSTNKRTPRKKSAASRKVQLAETLIENWTDTDFDFAAYEDRYREQVQRLVNAKVKGREIVTPEEEEEPSEVINLMDALQKSVRQAMNKGKKSAPAPKNKRRRSA